MSQDTTGGVDRFVNELLAAPTAAPAPPTPPSSTPRPEPVLPTPPVQTAAPAATAATASAPSAAAQEDAWREDFLRLFEVPEENLEDEAAVPQLRCVSFTVGEGVYATAIDSLYEVLPGAEIMPVPGVAAAVLGVLNLRGAIIPVLDPSAVLAQPRPADQRGQLLVAEHEGEAVALRVGCVQEVIVVDEDELQPPPAPAQAVRALIRVNDEMVTLLDLAQLVAAILPAPAH